MDSRKTLPRLLIPDDPRHSLNRVMNSPRILSKLSSPVQRIGVTEVQCVQDQVRGTVKYGHLGMSVVMMDDVLLEEYNDASHWMTVGPSGSDEYRLPGHSVKIGWMWQRFCVLASSHEKAVALSVKAFLDGLV